MLCSMSYKRIFFSILGCFTLIFNSILAPQTSRKEGGDRFRFQETGGVGCHRYAVILQVAQTCIATAKTVWNGFRFHKTKCFFQNIWFPDIFNILCFLPIFNSTPDPQTICKEGGDIFRLQGTGGVGCHRIFSRQQLANILLHPSCKPLNLHCNCKDSAIGFMFHKQSVLQNIWYPDIF